jgi:hypothetical protein
VRIETHVRAAVLTCGRRAQAGLTTLGNFTLWYAAYRIYQSMPDEDQQEALDEDGAAVQLEGDAVPSDGLVNDPQFIFEDVGFEDNVRERNPLPASEKGACGEGDAVGRGTVLRAAWERGRHQRG